MIRMRKAAKKKRSKSRVDARGPGTGASPQQNDEVLLRLRGRIASAIQANHPKLAEGLSSIRFAIGTFVPSEILKQFEVSDYPFIGARYVSLYDGHVYIVAGTCDIGKQVLAYRLGFLQSIFGTKGGIAVGITEEAWMNGVMIMFSLNHAGFSFTEGGRIDGVDDEKFTRRSYPLKKLRAWGVFWRRMVFGSPGAMDLRSPDEAHEHKQDMI